PVRAGERDRGDRHLDLGAAGGAAAALRSPRLAVDSVDAVDLLSRRSSPLLPRKLRPASAAMGSPVRHAAAGRKALRNRGLWRPGRTGGNARAASADPLCRLRSPGRTARRAGRCGIDLLSNELRSAAPAAWPRPPVRRRKTGRWWTAGRPKAAS